MKNRHAHHASLLAASIVGILLATHAGGATAAIEPPGLGDKKAGLKKVERKIMNVLIETYADTDWSRVIDHMTSHPEDGGNPNTMVIPLSLGNVFLNRYEKAKSASDYERALQNFEWVAEKYDLWKSRWLTPAVVQYLVVSVDRIRKACHESVNLPEPWTPRHKRVNVLWKKVKSILKREADYRLTVELPYAPYESCFTGDTKAEENAWESALFAGAANFLPDDPQASAWDGRARQLAYNSITRPSDPPDSAGIKTCTVAEDLTLSNHGLTPNPYYAGATLFLLTQGALPYRLAGRPVPEEFTHNVAGLVEKYTSYLGSDLSWNVPSDPEGDGALFPLVFDSRLEKEAVLRKGLQGYLWKPTPPVPVMGTGSDLWEAIQNSKVVLYYLMGSYLWHFPSHAECFDVRYTMPEDGEVQ